MSALETLRKLRLLDGVLAKSRGALVARTRLIHGPHGSYWGLRMMRPDQVDALRVSHKSHFEASPAGHASPSVLHGAPPLPSLDDMSGPYRDYVRQGVNTPAFREWFGDWKYTPEKASKVVIPGTGVPILCYPAGKDTPKMLGHAYYFLESRGTLPPDLDESLICYLNIRNPLDADAPFTPALAKKLTGPIYAHMGNAFVPIFLDKFFGKPTKDALESLWHFNLPGKENVPLTDIVSDAGFDGILTHLGARRLWIAFDLRQVKARRNLGTFDKNVADIHKSLSPSNDEEERMPGVPPPAAIPDRFILSHDPDAHVPNVDDHRWGEFGSPQPHLMEEHHFLPEDAWNRRERAHYFIGDTKLASSRTSPQTPHGLPVGSWRISSFHGPHGREIEQLRELDPHSVVHSESEPGRAGDVHRYAHWAAQGSPLPPIEATETDKGTIQIRNGHRRALAAQLAGAKLFGWVSPAAPHPDGVKDSEGRVLPVGLTYEMAKAGAGPLFPHNHGLSAARLVSPRPATIQKALTPPVGQHVTLYHGTHKEFDALKPVAQAPRSPDQLGSWFTSSPDYAKRYGPRVYSAQVDDGHLMDAPHTDFHRLFGSNIPLVEQHLGAKKAKVLLNTLPDSPRRRELRQQLNKDGFLEPEHAQELGKLEAAHKVADEALHHTGYLKDWHAMMGQHYRGIRWRDSDIDLAPGEKPHDVYMMFNHEPIPAQKHP